MLNVIRYFGGVTKNGTGFVARQTLYGTFFTLENGTEIELSRYWRLGTWDLSKESYQSIRATYLGQSK